MLFKNYVSIDAHFQNSINIGLDLYDDEKVNSYIPTNTGMNFLNYFIKNILDNNGENSNMLIAPYGKGKSHAMLVLLSLLINDDYERYSKLLGKIKQNNQELFENIQKVRLKKFLPVVISNTRGTLNQSLMNSLKKSLQNEHIDNIVLDTEFSQAKDRIVEWKKSYPETYVRFREEIKNRKVKLKDFAQGLEENNEDILDLFKDIHKSILSGAEFVSHNTMEIVDYYQKVSIELKNKHGYDGLYIVFDEFSKFLESREESTVSNDMKIIQDLAELCNNSKDTNMYLQLILHKPISDYLSLNKIIRNAFKGIEGRVTAYYFTTDLRNSFDLISNVLQKRDEFYLLMHEKEQYFNNVVNNIKDLPAFYVDFDNDYLENKIINNCFPLHPMTTYLLIKTNEKIAQNERTLFTFLAKKTQYSLSSIIENEYEEVLILPDIIFDYFKNLLLEEKDNVAIQRITTQAISALNSVRKQEYEVLIKTIALLLIINEKDNMPTNISVLSKALMLENNECRKYIDALIKKGILIERHDGQIQFKINMDLNLNSSIDNLVNTKFVRINLEKELSNILGNKYFYPRTYNTVNCITRYFKIEYILEKDYLMIKDLNHYFENEYSDGLILNVIREENDNYSLIKEHTMKLDNQRVVTVYPKKYTDFTEIVKKILAVTHLLNDNEFIDNNILIKAELELILDDLKEVLISNIDVNYGFSSKGNYICSSFNNGELNETKGILSKNRILGNILEFVFNQYPNNLNLELINKNNVNGVYKQAREKVIERLLTNTIDIEKLGTSPEDTIINCLLIETGILLGNVNEKIGNIIALIDDFLINSEGESFNELYQTLIKPPYGLRKGIIPLLIGYSMSKIKDCIFLKFKGQELELNAKNIELINDDPQNFVFVIDRIDQEKIKYINDLSSLLNCQLSNELSKNYSIVVTSLKQWFASLPKLTKQMIGDDKTISSKEYKLLKKKLNQTDINPSEFVLYDLLKIVKVTNLSEVVPSLKTMKDKLDSYYDNYLLTVKQTINELLGFDKDVSIVNSTNYWINQNIDKFNTKVLDSITKSFIDTCEKSKSLTEDQAINNIAYCLTSLFLVDWAPKTLDILKQQLIKIKEIENVELEEVNSIDLKPNQITMNIDGKIVIKTIEEELEPETELVETFITSTMDDYNDLLTNEQKVSLLLKIMKKYM